MNIPAPTWLNPELVPVLARYYPILAGIQWVVLDVDGVLTNGDITYTSTGQELKQFNVKDGQGLNLLAKVGVSTALITARQSSIVTQRAEELAITRVFQHAKPKLPVLQGMLNAEHATLSQVAYMGDDWPDCAILNQVGFATCPQDAMPMVQSCCHWISQQPGGRGAVRELCDLLLAAKGFDPYV
jgi:3-deoxy-D-manno-octulosonate 8-phosphate phosphatase (KDO 8-P phosphatase)